jgi:uncharacterized protein YndB with AHSA1/START domain
MKIEKHYEFPFPPEIVYAAWVSSDTVIPPATAMDIDPVVGGHYRLTAEMPGYVGKNEGKFLAVEPGRHLRYTWEWNQDGKVSEIDVTFVDSGDGSTVTLVHSGFADQDSVDSHDSGWDSYANGLREFLKTQ